MSFYFDLDVLSGLRNCLWFSTQLFAAHLTPSKCIVLVGFETIGVVFNVSLVELSPVPVLGLSGPGFGARSLWGGGGVPSLSFA